MLGKPTSRRTLLGLLEQGGHLFVDDPLGASAYVGLCTCSARDTSVNRSPNPTGLAVRSCRTRAPCGSRVGGAD